MLRFFENFDLGRNCLEKKKKDIFLQIFENFRNFENPRLVVVNLVVNWS